MTDRLHTRVGHAMSHVGLLAARGLGALNGQVIALRERAEERERQRQAQIAAVTKQLSKGSKSAEARIAAAVDTYTPQVTQADVEAVSWDTPWPVADLLTAERKRIRAIVLPIYEDEVGVPPFDELPTKALADQAYEVWEAMHRPFHAKAFDGLRLPPYFQFVKGVLIFEDTYTEDTTLEKIATGTRDLIELDYGVRKNATNWLFEPPEPRQIGEQSGYYYADVPKL